MLMGYVEARKNQSQQDDDESEPKYKWVQCPDIPDGLLTNDQDDDDESPHGSTIKKENDWSE